MKRIAAIVINSVSHDARVLKQADSLASAGHDVTVFGIQDNRCSDPEAVLESGVRIRRIDYKGELSLRMARLIMVAGLVTTAALIVTHRLWFDPVFDVVTSRRFLEIASLVVIVALLIPFYRLSRVWFARARRYGAVGASKRSWFGLERRSNAPVPTLASQLKRARNLVVRWVQRGAIKRRLRDEVTLLRPDVVHCHDLNTLAIGDACKRQTRCKIVFDSHELYEARAGISRLQAALNRWEQRRLSRKVDALITINDSIGNFLHTEYPRFPAPIIVKNAAKTPSERIADDGRLRAAAGVDPTQRILLYQGGFARHRGLEALVKASALLPPGWCLVMMGWGSLEDPLRKVADELDGNGDRVRFIPAAPQEELAHWTAGASLGAIPYENVCLNHWYCTPNKLWEYPLAGVPILASPFPELRGTILKHSIGRLLPDPATPEAIAETVGAITDAELEELRANCRKYVAEDNWSVYEKRLIAMYDAL